MGQKAKEPTKRNGAMPSRTRGQCGEAITGQNCDNLVLKKNNEFSALKQIESVKSQ